MMEKKLMNTNNTSLTKTNSVLFSISLIIIAGIFINIAGIFIIVLPLSFLGKFQLLIVGIFMCVGFIYIPYNLSKRINIKVNIHFNIFRTILYILIIPIVSILIFSVSIEEIIHPMIVGVCEEYLFRGVIFSVLLTSFKKRYVYLIGSLMFAIILHLNGDFMSNFLIKFPSSIILFYLADKGGLQDSIAFHWVYNMLVTKL